MYVLIIVLTLLAAVLLIGVVLIQKSKGGGLSSSFAGSNQIMGVRRTTNFIEKVTWTLAGAIAVLAVVSVFFLPGRNAAQQSRVQVVETQQTQPENFNTTAPVAAPATETPKAADAPAATPAPAPVAE